jgi:succinate dehydrogenase / fumarate reductase cytochrome b subunit
MDGQKGRYDYFLLRRLQSLFGIFPLAAFLFVHFTFNSFVFGGPNAFNKLVDVTQGFPLIEFLEIGLIAIPLLIHILLGLIIIYRGSVNLIPYSYYRNWMYIMQRITGFIAMIYVFYHVWSTRLQAFFTGRHITFADMQQHFGPTWVKVFYMIGIMSVVFHLANGLATAFMTWGITASKRSQFVMAVVTWIITLGMGAWGLRILLEFIS